MPPFPLRPAVALLSRKALKRNLEQIRARISENTQLHQKSTQVMAVVKADAYGHDLTQILPELEKNKIRHFAVASLEEGIQARKVAKSASEILVLGGTFRWTLKALDVVRHYRLGVAVNDVHSLETLAKYPEIPIHLKFDTGMNRLGIKPNEWSEALRLLKKHKHVLTGVFTHFATAGDRIFERQSQLFEEAVRWVHSEGLRPQFVHSENSAALFHETETKVKKGIVSELGNLVRPGLSLYGYHPSGVKSRYKLEPVLELMSEIRLLKDLEKGEGVSYGHLYRAPKKHDYAVVTLGYADGLSKLYGRDLLPERRDRRGKRLGELEILGAVCMDMVMVKERAPKKGKLALRPGDHCVFWGRFPNALLSRGIVEAYELNLRISKRIPRIWSR